MEEIQPRPRESLGPLASGALPLEVSEEGSGWESVRSLLSDVNRYRGAALLFFAAVFLLTVVATFSQKPIYEGIAVVKIGTGAESSSIVPYRQIGQDQIGQESANAFEYDTFFRTEIEILKSRAMAERVVDRLNLEEHPDWVGLKPGWRKAAKRANLEEEPYISPVAGLLVGNLRIEPVRNTRLVKIRCESPSAFGAAQLANVYAQSFITFGLDRKLEANRYARKFLAGQLETLRKKVAQSEERLADFMAETGIVRVSQMDKSPAEQELGRLSEAIFRARLDLLRREVRLERAKEAFAGGKAGVPENPYTVELKKLLLKEEAKYREMEEIYKPEYPRMVQVHAEIQGLQDELNQEKEASVADLDAEYEAAKRNYAGIEQEFQKAMEKVRGETKALSRYTILKREADTDREMYVGVLKRMRETDITSAINASNVEVLEHASVPQSPSRPKKGRNLLLGFLGGGLGGLGLAVGLARFDTRLRGKEEVERTLGLPVLGQVPDTEKLKAKGIDEIPADLPMAFAAHVAPDSAVSNSFRQIRTLLHYSLPDRRPQVMLITSCQMGEGKTSTTVNTATVLGQQGTVLLIDADLRRPNLHKILGLRPHPGLSELLTNQASLGNAVQATALPNVWAIGAGRTPCHPADLLGAAAMAYLCQWARGHFTYVILDCPPLVGMPDAAVVATLTDGVLLVIRDGAVDRSDARRVVETLSVVNTRILGIVLNRVQQANRSYYAYHYAYRLSEEQRRAEALRAPSQPPS
ncbi:tyrosine-protein kinase Etk/Wzc [Methylacidimicrobium cyclopophantes]|uniref:Tyrosine-protein kinase Etk/Wzc n=1 Tax=Methylacidimicrobium cyclopophantes TaxID=1041766 RepID=A0A5E6MPC4_9BACT|nr:polysaccharide biosynthesis tyrosine autokinase [Methylacidimicrobium cyclopophantes]VVM07838.1 tyrosine-protein kinase Etk/Wzc [Methylacidimicrobium cyclopophantes]